MKELYFHEDFYYQVELLPTSALESSAREMGDINAFSAAHWDGYGWTDIYVRQDQSNHLRSLGISIDTIAAALDPILDPVDEVYTGYSTHRELCNNTRGWAVPCGTALLADFNDSGVVEHLWIVNEPPNSEDVEQFRRALKSLNDYGDFFIADWNLSIALSCKDDDKLVRYLSGEPDDGTE
jgi:hypothetical protein